MRMRRIVATAGAAVLAVSGLVMAGAAPAAADQIWYQAVGSPSKDAPCAESSAEDLALGWSTWAKSYAEWPNDGKGGWTCERSILWAKGTPPSSAAGPGCVLVESDPNFYLDFGSGNVAYDIFLDPGCTDLYGRVDPGTAYVYAASLEAATEVCNSLVGPLDDTLYRGNNVYFCRGD